MFTFLVLSCEDCTFDEILSMMPVIGTKDKFVVIKDDFFEVYKDDEIKKYVTFITEV